MVGVAQRDVGILFGKQEGDAFFLVEALHDFEYLFHQLRRKPHGRFVEQHDLGFGHQRATDGDHLLFAARGIAGLRARALLQARKIIVNQLQILLDRGIAVAPRVGAGQQVFLDREMLEAMPAFHDLDDALLHQFRGRHLVDAFAEELDAALGDVTALGA